MTDGNNTTEKVKTEQGFTEVSGREIEQGMIEQEEKRFEDPAEMAAMLFTMYMPRFQSALGKLNHGAKHRLINHLVSYPIGKDYLPNTEDEKEAWSIGQAMIESKFVLVLDQYKNGLEQLTEAAGITTETTMEPVENTEGENNG